MAGFCSNSAWIWLAEQESADQYAEFHDSFQRADGDVRLLISADSNYAVYLNGTLAAAGQYPDFPHYKIYDELDVTPFCRPGVNHLAIRVWYYGVGSMTYYPGRAALRYELHQQGTLSCSSSAGTLSRKSLCYDHGRQKIITGQLGLSFRCDLTQEDNWLQGELQGFAPSRIVPQQLPLYPRPVERLVWEPPVPVTPWVNENGTLWRMDLGREEAGMLTLKVFSAEEQDVLIAYGEHLSDGCVRRQVGGRDFSVELRLKEGWNEYVNPFRRLGLRYLELHAASPVQVERLTVIPVYYPVCRTEQLPVMSPLQKRIYDVSVRTLRLCMHEHYEDTPWREQALYVMDSRNQMLCGYDAFREYAFARANLLLISKDNREDGLLSICTPSRENLTIPSFSLHYFMAVEEYTRFSGDRTLAREIWPKLLELLQVFVSRMEDGCLPVFSEAWHWNFYEWSDGLSGNLRKRETRRFDAALNCLLSMALQSMQRLADLLELEGDFLSAAHWLNRSISARFYNAQRKLFINSTEDANASVLVNALAILCGAAQGECACQLAQTLSRPDHGLTPVTLSMAGFLYDALLATDRERYAPFVLSDIETKYQKMLDAGATSFWETEKGESDFDNAGSLCHGWSALPVHYFHLLLPTSNVL